MPQQPSLYERPHGYQPIHTDDPEKEGEPSSFKQLSSSPLCRGWLFFCLVCVCLVVNISLLFASSLQYPFTNVVSSSKKFSWQDIQSLRRPSQFIGLDRDFLEHHPTSLNITNYPTLLAQVDRQDPDVIVNSESLREETRIGTIVPNRKRVRVTNTISTVVQFRALDIGLEYCKLTVSFPDPVSSHPTDLQSNSSVQIWGLESFGPINPASLTHRSRPRRNQLLATVEVGPLQMPRSSHEFVCEMDSLWIFELACPEGESCDVEWWQDRDVSDNGIVIRQSALKAMH